MHVEHENKKVLAKTELQNCIFSFLARVNDLIN